MKTEITVDDNWDVVDFLYGEKVIAKLDRQTKVFHINVMSKGPELEKFLADNIVYLFEVKEAKKVFHDLVCKRTLFECEHTDCMCKNCESGLENEEKCNTCDYFNCCDKE